MIVNGQKIQVLDGSDAKNVGLKCCKCGSHQVIYHISVPRGKFQAGSYCYKCLLQTCLETHQVPLPMEADLLDKLQFDAELRLGKKTQIVGGANVGQNVRLPKM